MSHLSSPVMDALLQIGMCMDLARLIQEWCYPDHLSFDREAWGLITALSVSLDSMFACTYRQNHFVGVVQWSLATGCLLSTHVLSDIACLPVHEMILSRDQSFLIAETLQSLFRINWCQKQVNWIQSENGGGQLQMNDTETLLVGMEGDIDFEVSVFSTETGEHLYRIYGGRSYHRNFWIFENFLFIQCARHLLWRTLTNQKSESIAKIKLPWLHCVEILAFDSTTGRIDVLTKTQQPGVLFGYRGNITSASTTLGDVEHVQTLACPLQDEHFQAFHHTSQVVTARSPTGFWQWNHQIHCPPTKLVAVNSNLQPRCLAYRPWGLSPDHQTLGVISKTNQICLHRFAQVYSDGNSNQADLSTQCSSHATVDEPTHRPGCEQPICSHG